MRLRRKRTRAAGKPSRPRRFYYILKSLWARLAREGRGVDQSIEDFEAILSGGEVDK